MSESKVLNLKGAQVSVSPSDVDADGMSAILVNEDRIPIYCSEFVTLEDGAVTMSVFASGEYGDSFILPADYVKVLNEGIKLAAKGYSSVELDDVSGDEYNGKWDNVFDDIASLPKTMSEPIISLHETVREALEDE